MKLARIGVLLLLAGCQLHASSDTCDVGDYAHLIGMDRALLANEMLPHQTRVLGPDSFATTDHVPERLNIYVDAGGKVERISCG